MSKFPFCKNWKDLITNDCIVVIDSDQTAYQAAAGAEERSILVTHKASGKQKAFKNRTEFYGKTKNTVGGWLKDQNTNREAKALAAGKEFIPWTRDDFTIEDVQTPQPLEFCLQTLKMKVTGILNYLGFPRERCICVLGGKGNFRDDLVAPQVYKGNREDTLRPIHLKEARQYLVEHFNAKVIDGIEADDYLSKLAYEGFKHYKKTGKFSYIVVSFDKDQKGNPCLLFDPMKDDKTHTWKYPFPMLIDDSMGEVWVEKNKVKGWGRKFFGYQMLCGDSTDNIRPYQDLLPKRSFGDAAALKILAGTNTEKEMWSAIVDQYKTWYPDGVKFTDWKGDNQEMTAGQWASIIFQMLYMKLEDDDKTTLGKVLRNVGVI